jgi:hypothetical protein
MDVMMNLIKGENFQLKRLAAEFVERKSTAPPKI